MFIINHSNVESIGNNRIANLLIKPNTSSSSWKYGRTGELQKALRMSERRFESLIDCVELEGRTGWWIWLIEPYLWSVSGSRQIQRRWRGRYRRVGAWRRTWVGGLALGRRWQLLHSIGRRSSSCSGCGCGRRGSSRERGVRPTGMDPLKREIHIKNVKEVKWKKNAFRFKTKFDIILYYHYLAEIFTEKIRN